MPYSPGHPGPEPPQRCLSELKMPSSLGGYLFFPSLVPREVASEEDGAAGARCCAPASWAVIQPLWSC